MREPVLVVLFGFAIGVYALIMLSLVESRDVRIALRVVVVVAMIPFVWFGFFFTYWLITGFRPS